MGACPKGLGMWAGFIYLFDCVCTDQLTLLGLTHVRCWFQTQRRVPPAVPSSAPPHPPHPHSLIPLAFGHAGKEEAYCRHRCMDTISQSAMSVLTTCSTVPVSERPGPGLPAVCVNTVINPAIAHWVRAPPPPCPTLSLTAHAANTS